MPCIDTPAPPPPGWQVLLVGKALNFIRLGCKDTEWSLELAAPRERTRRPASKREAGAEVVDGARGALPLGKLEYGREEELQSLVDRAAMRANAHLLRLMIDK